MNCLNAAKLCVVPRTGAHVIESSLAKSKTGQIFHTAFAWVMSGYQV